MKFMTIKDEQQNYSKMDYECKIHYHIHAQVRVLSNRARLLNTVTYKNFYKFYMTHYSTLLLRDESLAAVAPIRESAACDR
jgi:hypothetical protein